MDLLNFEMPDSLGFSLFVHIKVSLFNWLSIYSKRSN